MESREQLVKAKIPCDETGIEIRHTLCAICSPSNHCGIDAYVKDGKLLKVEGTDEHPKNQGILCTKGLSNREFIYRKDRILSPLRRIGARGEGKFEPISWDEAYVEITARLNGIKDTHGADTVAFFGGYSKWYRPWLRRFAHSFGSMSYGTESSTCMTSGWIAWKVAAGCLARPDMGNCDLFLGWAYNPYHSKHLNAAAANKAKENGMKFIIVDPRITPAVEKLADLHLRPYPGTDGALALCMGNILIRKGWVDKAYIDDYVHGFEAYAEYASQFNEDNIKALTGVPYNQVLVACTMIHESKAMAINDTSAPIPHHKNGMQNYRAIMALSALTGNFDRKGGQQPATHTFTHQISGFATREEEFANATEPVNARPAVGAERFPLWYYLEREMQAVDLARQILEDKPYPIKAVFAMGMNYRMFPDDNTLKKAIEKLDFFVNTDLFLTDTAKLADIVLPVCSSFERGEFMTYAKGYAWYTNPVINRIGDCKSDTEILCDLSNYLDLKDEMLKAGYEENIRYIISDLNITVEELKSSEFPVHVPKSGQPAFGTYSAQRFATPTGKFELYSELIASHPEWELEPLPAYCDPLNDTDRSRYPYILCSGGRKPQMLHSRLHGVPWLRSLQPDPTADISLIDAQKLEIRGGDEIELFTENGLIRVKAQPTSRVQPGVIFFCHGYSEADVNQLMSGTHVDPYTGFPAYNATCCGMRKREADEKVHH